MKTIAIVVFLCVMVAIISEKVHRTTAALIGATLLMVLGIFDLDGAIKYIDANTIGVLIGMMIFVAVIKCSGIFEYIAIKSAKMGKGNPWKIMVAFMIITALLSAVLDNVTTVLLIGPMTITIARMLDVNPVPFIISQILAADVGGTATMIGDPTHIMIGSASGYNFIEFLQNVGLVSLICMVVLIVMMRLIYGKNMGVKQESVEKIMSLDEKKSIIDDVLMKKSIFVIILIVIGFSIHDKIGMASCMVAMIAAGIMLLIGKQNVENVIADVEWSTIIFFASLFVVVGGLEETGVIADIANILIDLTGGNQLATILLLLWASAIISSILDNIPFIATLIPIVMTLGDRGMDIAPFWWAIALGGSLGGTGTLIGASANLVLSGISNKYGYPITFKNYMKVGYPFMFIALSISSVFLFIKYGI